jgi:hypothetical protein
MPTYREGEVSNAENAATIRFAERLASVLERSSSLISFVLYPVGPLLRRLATWSPSARVGLVGRLTNDGKMEEAFELAVQTIEDCLDGAGLFVEMHRKVTYWVLLDQASDLARSDQQVNRVIALLDRRPETDAWYRAKILEKISRWHWQAGSSAQAVEFARCAVESDPTWPQGHTTLAFYLREAKLGDPVQVLADAVRAGNADWAIIEEYLGPEMVSAVRTAV